MSIWSDVLDAIQRFAKSGSLSDLFAGGAGAAPEKSVAFTVAVVALGAKLAKADGRVTRDEVDAFKEVFLIPAQEEASAARVFNMARDDVAGYLGYARQIRAMFRDADDKATLEDILDGLFHIAGADGVYDPAELAFLWDVADVFGIEETCFNRLKERHDPDSGGDPYTLLGVERSASLEEIRQAWRALARESHPDRMMARGVPEEAVRMATERLRVLNGAFERIRAERSAA